jgi:hypothetical protein
MGIINDYLNGIQKRYPATQEVREQIEELRDTLHMKAEELQAQGVSYDEASKRAVNELGDVTPLLDQVAGNMRSVYISRFARGNAIADSCVILGTYLFGWLVFLLFTNHQGNEFILPFLTLTGLFIVGLGIWPLVAHLNYRKQPDKVDIVTMNFRRHMKIALFSWLGITLVLAIVNISMMNAGYSGAWLMWPIIGIANWPLNICLYHRQLVGGRYDAAA